MRPVKDPPVRLGCGLPVVYSREPVPCSFCLKYHEPDIICWRPVA